MWCVLWLETGLCFAKSTPLKPGKSLSLFYTT
jgi:hypothetical protein